MDSSRSLFGNIVPSRGMGLFRLSTSKEESKMNLSTMAVDLAKDVFQGTVANRRCQIVERHRLTIAGINLPKIPSQETANDLITTPASLTNCQTQVSLSH